MRKEKLWLPILGILMLLVLSGCINMVQEIYHYPDGSGKLVVEMIWNDEILALGDLEGFTMEDLSEELLEFDSTDDTYIEDHPNISAVNSKNFIDPDTGSLHNVAEVEVINILEPFTSGEEESFVIIANADGTYRFSVNLIDESASMTPDEMEFLEEYQPMLDSAEITYKLHVYEFIEGDPLASYDPFKKIVTWVIPMNDLLDTNLDPEIWAVYRVDAPVVIEEEPEIVVPEPVIVEEVVEPVTPQVPLPPPAVVSPQQDNGFLGLPNWVPFVLAGLCCLSLVAVAVVILVVVVLKKRKNPAPPPNLY